MLHWEFDHTERDVGRQFRLVRGEVLTHEAMAERSRKEAGREVGPLNGAELPRGREDVWGKGP